MVHRLRLNLLDNRKCCGKIGQVYGQETGAFAYFGKSRFPPPHADHSVTFGSKYTGKISGKKPGDSRNQGGRRGSIFHRDRRVARDAEEGQPPGGGEVYPPMSRFTLCLCASLNGLLSIALVLPAFADAPTPFVTVTSSDSRDLHTSLDGLVNDPVFRHAGIGVMVQSLDTGHVLYEHDADRALMPASNNKILTAAAALLQLGTDYTFTTTLYQTGTVGADGTLSGDLFLRGMGDPSFASADLLAMAKTLQAQGIKRVNGRFVADASRFTDGPLGSGWSWDDEPYSYAPQISALTCDENVLLVSAAPSGTPGNPAQVTLGSDDDRKAGLGTTGYIRVRNTAMTVLPPKLPAAEPPTVSFERPRGQNLFAVSGAIALGAKPAIEVLTLEDPDVYTLTRLTELLPLAGVAVPEAYGSANRARTGAA